MTDLKLVIKSDAVHGTGGKERVKQIVVQSSFIFKSDLETEFVPWLETQVQTNLSLPGVIKIEFYSESTTLENKKNFIVETTLQEEKYLEKNLDKISLKSYLESSKFNEKIEISTKTRTFLKSFEPSVKPREKKDPIVYKNALITGTSSQGLGLEFCRQLVARGTKVYAICRKSTPALEKVGVTKIITDIELTDDIKSTKGVIDEVKDIKFDLVVQNAGVGEFETIDNLTRSGLRKQMETNTFAPLMMIQALRKNSNLTSGTRIILITSLSGSISDNKSGQLYGYRMSKAALNMAGVNLSHDLKSDGIIVGLLNPGFVDTEMAKPIPGQKISTETSVTGMLQVIDDLTLETSGGFWHYNGKQLPW